MGRLGWARRRIFGGVLHFSSFLFFFHMQWLQVTGVY